METQGSLNELNEKIQRLREMAQNLSQVVDDFPALDRNTARILASIKMLELNISDVAQVRESHKTQS